MQDKIFAGDVALDKLVVRVFRHVRSGGTVVQTIDIDDPDIGPGLEHMINEIRTNKATAAGD